MPSKATLRELALALGLTTDQIREVMRIGGVERGTRRRTIDAIKRVWLSLIEASEIWGFSNGSRQLGKHAENGTLEVANPDETYSRWNPRMVTPAAMLELMAIINRPSSGFWVDD